MITPENKLKIKLILVSFIAGLAIGFTAYFLKPETNSDKDMLKLSDESYEWEKKFNSVVHDNDSLLNIIYCDTIEFIPDSNIKPKIRYQHVNKKVIPADSVINSVAKRVYTILGVQDSAQ